MTSKRYTYTIGDNRYVIETLLGHWAWRPVENDPALDDYAGRIHNTFQECEDALYLYVIECVDAPAAYAHMKPATRQRWAVA